MNSKNTIIIINTNASWILSNDVFYQETGKGVIAPLWIMRRPQGLSGLKYPDPVRQLNVNKNF
jgi:hypothetical protein